MRTEILCLTLLMAIAGTTPANDIWQSLFREKLRDYGLFIKKPLIALFVTLLGVAIVSPFL